MDEKPFLIDIILESYQIKPAPFLKDADPHFLREIYSVKDVTRLSSGGSITCFSSKNSMNAQ